MLSYFPFAGERGKLETKTYSSVKLCVVHYDALWKSWNCRFEGKRVTLVIDSGDAGHMIIVSFSITFE